MALFDLIVDEKVEVWRRSKIKINAESLENAVINCLETGTADAKIIDSDYLYTTEVYLAPDDKHSVTVEVMDTNYVTLGTNETFSR